jgi:hypothetical protein
MWTLVFLAAFEKKDHPFPHGSYCNLIENHLAIYVRVYF